MLPTTKKRLLLLIVILIAVVGLSQLERFVRAGTLFGYTVRNVATKQALAKQNTSGKLVDGKISATNQSSISCDMYPKDKVAKIVGAEIERVAGFVPDRAKPLTSICNYKIKSTKVGGIQSVAILVRDLKDDASAKKTIDIIKQSKNITTITALGDQALFNASSNQLTVRTGKRLTTITVPKTANSKQDNKSIAKNIAKIAL